jgi:Transcriptional regulator
MQQILVTTYQEMNKYGMKFTMDDVAAQLGMSKKTLYKLFRSKNELVLAVIESLIQFVKAKEQIVLKSDVPLPQKLFDFLLLDIDEFGHPSSVFARDVCEQHPEAFKILQDFAAHRAKLLKELLDKSVAKGIIHPVHTGLVSDMLSCVAKTVLLDKLDEKNNMGFQESIRAIIDLITRGLFCGSCSTGKINPSRK